MNLRAARSDKSLSLTRNDLGRSPRILPERTPFAAIIPIPPKLWEQSAETRTRVAAGNMTPAWVSDKKAWNRGFVELVRKTLAAFDIAAGFPADLDSVLEALFTFRNASFHNGYDWPEDERAKFAAKVKAKGWQQWFTQATDDGKPWIFYVSDTFIDVCIDRADKSLLGIGTAMKTLKVY